MKRHSIRIPVLALPAAALLALAGCGSGGGEAAPAEETSAQTQQTREEGSDEASSPAAEQSGTSSARGGELDAALAAIATAEAEAGGTAFDVDFEEAETDDDDDDDVREAHWSVGVMDGDREQEVRVSADGAEVLGTEEDDVDGDDRREREAASVALADALETALGDTPGLLDDASLDDDGGTLHWEVGVYPEGEDRSTDVRVDAESGEVL
ncbi:PepSY domain-containing protein [Brevibacterium album]|uniref:PepSY domain-containing protein n=1 Tax=Brevibacterium album TaxID=417948 RepID=UPI000413DCD3|nr:PepSY domain-containing protein [Brevibacterium album]